MWMESDGHRRNILNCDLTTIGVGLDTDGWYWMQNFGRCSATATARSGSPCRPR